MVMKIPISAKIAKYWVKNEKKGDIQGFLPGIIAFWDKILMDYFTSERVISKNKGVLGGIPFLPVQL